MIYSMTAFARVEHQGEWGTLVCEMRSINHRYLEVGLHLPDVLRALEMPIREGIRQVIKRGKVDCSFRYQLNAAAGDALLHVNAELVQAICRASEEIAGFLKNPAPVHVPDILRFPGVLEAKEVDLTELQSDVLGVLKKTAEELLAARGREGEDLKVTFLQRLDLMQQEIAKVKVQLPSIMVEQREKLLKRFADAKIDLDPTRLEQEMVMYAQKIDVAEELDRTETHISEVRRVLKEGGIVGRRLDFLLQELNREANTLGSKSTDPVLTHAAVELKVLIEQIREQVQNIE